MHQDYGTLGWNVEKRTERKQKRAEKVGYYSREALGPGRPAAVVNLDTVYFF